MIQFSWKLQKKHWLRLLNEAKKIEVDWQNETQFVKNAWQLSINLQLKKNSILKEQEIRI